jgi:hypothetical protein
LTRKKIGHASCPVEAPTAQLKRSGSQASGKGPAEYFTGTVRIDPLFEAADPAPLASVSRSNSALEQHGIPIHWPDSDRDSCGVVQSWGGPIHEIRPGDVIWCPPGEKHWHGATPTTAITHIAIVEQLDSKAVDWMEKVSDEQ